MAGYTRDEMSQEEVAKALGLSLGGVRKIEERALRKIRAALAGWDGGYGSRMMEPPREVLGVGREGLGE